MTATRSIDRAFHVKDAITNIRAILKDVSFEQARYDRLIWPAFQRYLEIVSEASRHIAPSWKEVEAGIPWKEIANLGNLLRHVYHHASDDILWAIYAQDLDPLEAAIDRMITANSATPPLPSQT